MKSILSAFVAGLLFGWGLIVSEMANPKRVQGFLDITGQWDPTLVFVMVSALLVTTIGYRLILMRAKPLFVSTFSMPVNRVVDRRLIAGAALFGLGWGLSGFCPGPALVGMSTLNLDVVMFVVAMVVGMKGFEWIEEKT